MNIEFEVTKLATTLVLFTTWYLYQAFEYEINSRNNEGKQSYLFPFQCYWEDFLLYLPGKIGKNRRIKFMKNMLSSDGNFCPTTITCSNSSYSTSDVMQNGEYDNTFLLKCFNDVMGEGLYFHLKNILMLGILYVIF